MYKIHTSEAVVESDASNKDGSSGPGSDNSEAAESQDQGVTLAVTEMNNGGDLEGQGLKQGHGSE